MKLKDALLTDGEMELAEAGDGGGPPTFPGGAGEVVYVDGDGQAATSADFTFDDATKTLTVNGGSVMVGGISGGGVFGVPSDAPTATIIQANNAISTDATGSDLYLVAGIGRGAGDTGQITFQMAFPAASGPDLNALETIAYFSSAGDLNLLHLVRSPLFSAGFGVDGITTTVTTASLVGKTITITGGIITGFA